MVVPLATVMEFGLVEMEKSEIATGIVRECTIEPLVAVTVTV